MTRTASASRGADGAELDVAEPDGGVRLLGLDVGRNSGRDRARAPGHSGLARIPVRGVVGVEPELTKMQGQFLLSYVGTHGIRYIPFSLGFRKVYT
jgi:hypothetical protein